MTDHDLRTASYYLPVEESSDPPEQMSKPAVIWLAVMPWAVVALVAFAVL